MESLKREKDDAKKFAKGMECGIKIAGFNDVKEGDVLEAYKVERWHVRFNPTLRPTKSPPTHKRGDSPVRFIPSLP